MPARISWIQSGNDRFLLADFSGLRTEEEQIKLFDEFESEMVRSSQGKPVPAIVDITGALMTQEVTKRVRQFMSNTKTKGVPDSPVVLVGSSGLQKVVISSVSLFRQDVMTADTRSEAEKLLNKYLQKRGL